jgi:hypothetical protein
MPTRRVGCLRREAAGNSATPLHMTVRGTAPPGGGQRRAR